MQHDYTIAGGAGVGGAQVRGDIEDALLAAATGNSGNSAPSTLYENQRWTDLNTPSTDVWTDNVYDGSVHIPRGYVDKTNSVYQVHGAGVPIVPGGRCSLTSGLDVTVSDVTAATAIYYALSAHDFVPLWDGTRWDNYRFTQLTLALDSNSGHTGYHQSGKLFDLYVYRDSGTLRLGSSPAWTNDTTRSNALTRKNGRYVNNASIDLRYGSNSGDLSSGVAANTALYVGTFRASADGQTEDSLAKRFVWNTYNRAQRPMMVRDTTDSWSAGTNNTWRQSRASAANQIACVRGLDVDALSVFAAARAVGGTSGDVFLIGIGVDTTAGPTADASLGFFQSPALLGELKSQWVGFPGLGYHFAASLEFSTVTSSGTWYGDAGLAAGTYHSIQGTMPG